MPHHWSQELDAPFLFTEGSGLIKGEVIDCDHFRCGMERDAIPAQQPGYFQVARVAHDCYEN